MLRLLFQSVSFCRPKMIAAWVFAHFCTDIAHKAARRYMSESKRAVGLILIISANFDYCSTALKRKTF